MRGGLVHVAIHVEDKLRIAQRHRGDVHADGTVAGAAGENRHAAFVGGREHGAVLESQFASALGDIFAEQVMKLVGAHGALELRALDDLAHEGVGIEQHVVIEEHVVDADDAVAVEHRRR